MRVIADHLRAMTFLIADGVLPSNEWRGYVLRKIMRRAMRHGKKLGFTEPVLHSLVDVVIDGDGPRLSGAHDRPRLHRPHGSRGGRAFRRRADVGLAEARRVCSNSTAAAGAKTVPGDEVFRLYDSLGVPFDFAEDLAGQRGLTIDRAGYDAAMEGQRERARAASKFERSRAQCPRRRVDHKGEDRFAGYDRTTEPDAEVVAVHPGWRCHSLSSSWLDRTPFYVESGGQVSDTGTLTSAAALSAGHRRPPKAQPGTCARTSSRSVTGQIKAGDRVTAAVDASVRDATRRNHTATHLLHAALRKRLGTHVHQKGSLVAPDRLRFDFTHDAGLSAEERRDDRAHRQRAGVPEHAGVTEERTTDEAIKAGAMALFGEKYGDRVRVVSIAGLQHRALRRHACARHRRHRAVRDHRGSGVAAGVRRLEALTGAGAVAHLQAQQAAFAGYLAALGVAADQAPDAIAKLQAEVKRLARENEQLKMKAALGGGTGGGEIVRRRGSWRREVHRPPGQRPGERRSAGTRRIPCAIASSAAWSCWPLRTDGKVTLLVSVTKDLTDRVKAGQLVKDLAPIVGGGGGGRPDFAEAGGKDASKIDDLLAAARSALTKALG